MANNCWIRVYWYYTFANSNGGLQRGTAELQRRTNVDPQDTVNNAGQGRRCARRHAHSDWLHVMTAPPVHSVATEMGSSRFWAHSTTKTRTERASGARPVITSLSSAFSFSSGASQRSTAYIMYQFHFVLFQEARYQNMNLNLRGIEAIE